MMGNIAASLLVIVSGFSPEACQTKQKYCDNKELLCTVSSIRCIVTWSSPARHYKWNKRPIMAFHRSPEYNCSCFLKKQSITYTVLMNLGQIPSIIFDTRTYSLQSFFSPRTYSLQSLSAKLTKMNTWQNIYIRFKIVAHTCITCAMYRQEGNRWEGICPGWKNDGREYVRVEKRLEGLCLGSRKWLEGICPGGNLSVSQFLWPSACFQMTKMQNLHEISPYYTIWTSLTNC